MLIGLLTLDIPPLMPIVKNQREAQAIAWHAIGSVFILGAFVALCHFSHMALKKQPTIHASGCSSVALPRGER